MAKKATEKKSKKAAGGEKGGVNPRFVELSGKLEGAKAQPYRMASVYGVDAKIEHPKFGLGFVVSSLPDKIEVVFETSSRHLVQGRK